MSTPNHATIQSAVITRMVEIVADNRRDLAEEKPNARHHRRSELVSSRSELPAPRSELPTLASPRSELPPPRSDLPTLVSPRF
ncbi:hypothetical protein V6N13_121543 [Hibiscus sabdariffa]